MKPSIKSILIAGFLIYNLQFTIYNSATAQGLWTRKADFGGTARDAAVGFSIGNKGYIGTGYDDSHKKDFWEYDPNKNTWTQKADFGGTARSGAIGFSINNKGYIGTGTTSSSPLKDFWEYDPNSNQWTRKADYGGIGGEYPVGFSIGNKGYIGTGNVKNIYYADFWEYDPSSDKWTKKADFGGGARKSAVSFSIGTKGYIGIGMYSSYCKDFWEYDPSTDKWTMKADFGGTKRIGAVGFSIGNKGFIGTGNTGGNSVYDDFWEYDPSTNLWTQKANFGGGKRQYATGFSIGNKGYIGTGDYGGTYYKDFWEFNPSVTIPNKIKGKIFTDTDTNCISNANDYPLQNILIQAKSTQATYYATTDTAGNYTILTDTGTYIISPINNNPLFKLNCKTADTVSFHSYGDSIIDKDYSYKAEYYCAKLSVDIATPRLRMVGTNIYSVQYCNNGTMPATNAEIKINFGEVVIPKTFTFQKGETYTLTKGFTTFGETFNIATIKVGNIAIGECRNFTITTALDSAAIVGSTHCVTAKITPDSSCIPIDNAWDKSSVAVTGYCVNDSISRFIIRNVKGFTISGETFKDMAGNSEYRIYIDNILVQKNNFRLKAGDSTVIDMHPCGHTIRLEADQRPHYPYKSRPRASLEGCGKKCGKAVYGMMKKEPQDDADDFIEMDCHEIIASFDPNDKAVNPEGYTDKHFITPKDELEYMIRFQNTGTDTAFTVVIRDSISEHLDLSTLTSGASSHKYKFKIYGTGVAEWTFNNILLPDSNVNEPKSHGFIKYKINQKKNLEQGTVIENRAGIFFDMNPPVITNTTMNTVYDTTIICEIPKAKIIGDNLITMCQGGTHTLSISTSAHQHISTLSYQWQYYGSNINGANDTVYNATISGEYTVAITNFCGTDTSEKVVINMVAPPTVAATASAPVLCSGVPVTLTAKANAADTYLWTSTPTSSIINYQLSIINLTPTITTTYSIEVNNQCGKYTDEIIITVNETPATDAGFTQTICPPDSATIGHIHIQGNHNHQWSSNPKSQILNSNSSMITVTPTVTTTYTLTETDSISGCSAKDEVEIKVSCPQIIMGKISQTTYCAGDSIRIPFTSTNSNFCAFYPPGFDIPQYGFRFWAQLSIVTDSFVKPLNVGIFSIMRNSDYAYFNNIKTTGLVTDTIIAVIPNDILGDKKYRIRVISCKKITSKDNGTDLTINPLPINNLGKDYITCLGIKEVLSDTATKGETYLWTSTPLSIINYQLSTIIVTTTTTTTYSLAVTNNCGTTTDDIIITLVEPPTASIWAADTVICQNSSTILYTDTAHGYEFEWKPETAVNKTNIFNPYTTATTTTTYTLIVTNYCDRDTAQIVVKVNEAPVADFDYEMDSTFTPPVAQTTLGQKNIHFIVNLLGLNIYGILVMVNLVIIQ